MMSRRDNILRSVRFERPERIPMAFWINPACQNHYEALICDMADGEPRLWQLVEMIEAHNEATVRCSLRRGAEWMGYPEDLGMQVGPMLSPEHLRKYIKPSYERLMKPARDAGCIIHMHSDGDVRDLVDDLVDSGVQVVNLQDLVNGIEWIRQRFKGKMCIDLDIDIIT